MSLYFVTHDCMSRCCDCDVRADYCDEGGMIKAVIEYETNTHKLYRQLSEGTDADDIGMYPAL